MVKPSSARTFISDDESTLCEFTLEDMFLYTAHPLLRGFQRYIFWLNLHEILKSEYLDQIDRYDAGSRRYMERVKKALEKNGYKIVMDRVKSANKKYETYSSDKDMHVYINTHISHFNRM